MQVQRDAYDEAGHPDGCRPPRAGRRHGLFACLEAKLTAAWVEVPVEGGEAELWHAALHGLLGLGYAF